MKLTCQRSALQTACNCVQGAVAARTTKPVLSNVKAIAKGDTLTLMAQDTEVGIRYVLKGITSERDGSAILPVANLSQILREHDDHDIMLDAEEDGTDVRIGTSQYRMSAYPVDEFPEVPELISDNYHELNAGSLQKTIARTAFAADKKESTRFALSGVLWEAEGKQAKLVATDSKRLAVCTADAALFGEAPDKKRSHLVPMKAVGLLSKNLTDDGEMVRVALSQNEAMFQTERWMIYTRLVEGRYPPYLDLLKGKPAIKLPLPTSLFLSKVRQAAIMSDDETCRVDMTFAPGRLTIKARGAESGSSEVTMPLEGFDYPAVSIAFDPQYLIEFLKVVADEPSVMLEMTDGTKPALFRVGVSTVCLVMPLAS